MKATKWIFAVAALVIVALIAVFVITPLTMAQGPFWGLQSSWMGMNGQQGQMMNGNFGPGNRMGMNNFQQGQMMNGNFGPGNRMGMRGQQGQMNGNFGPGNRMGMRGQQGQMNGNFGPGNRMGMNNFQQGQMMNGNFGPGNRMGMNNFQQGRMMNNNFGPGNRMGMNGQCSRINNNSNFGGRMGMRGQQGWMMNGNFGPGNRMGRNNFQQGPMMNNNLGLGRTTPQWGGPQNSPVALIAEQLDLTLPELMTEWQTSDQTLSEIITAYELEPDAIIDTFLNQRTEQIDEWVANGQMTQEEADLWLEQIESEINTAMDQTWSTHQSSGAGQGMMGF